MSRIMIVDDEVGVLNALRRLLSRAPCTYGRLSYTLEVEVFDSPLTALNRARETSFDLVLADYHMPDMDGVAFLKQVEQIQPDAARMILSGCNDINVLNQSIHQANIYGMVPKPWSDYFLMSMIAQALNNRDLLLENRALARQAQVAPAPVPPASATHATPVEWTAEGAMVFTETPSAGGGIEPQS